MNIYELGWYWINKEKELIMRENMKKREMRIIRIEWKEIVNKIKFIYK